MALSRVKARSSPAPGRGAGGDILGGAARPGRAKTRVEDALRCASRLTEREGFYDPGVSRHLRGVWVLAAQRPARLLVGVRRLLGVVPVWPGDDDHRDPVAGLPAARPKPTPGGNAGDRLPTSTALRTTGQGCHSVLIRPWQTR